MNRRDIIIAFIIFGCLVLFFSRTSETGTKPGESTPVPIPIVRPGEIEGTPQVSPEVTPEGILKPALKNTPELFNDLVYTESENAFDLDISKLETFISDANSAISYLQEECATENKYTAEAISLMLKEIDRITTEQVMAVKQKDAYFKWNVKEAEYYYAARTWKYLKRLGYSDAACAGIIGNAMVECGGNSLKLDPCQKPYVSDKGHLYYGIFQWALRYYPEANGLNFEEQLDYYNQTSERIFKDWGKRYKDGFILDDFKEFTDPREAALAFAIVYERCSSLSYKKRQNLSEIAYQYFVLDFEE